MLFLRERFMLSIWRNGKSYLHRHTHKIEVSAYIETDFQFTDVIHKKNRRNIPFVNLFDSFHTWLQTVCNESSRTDKASIDLSLDSYIFIPRPLLIQNHMRMEVSCSSVTSRLCK